MVYGIILNKENGVGKIKVETQKLLNVAKKYVKFKECDKAIDYLKQALELEANYEGELGKSREVQDLINDIIILTYEDKIKQEEKLIQKKQFNNTIQIFKNLLEIAEKLNRTEIRNKIKIAKIKSTILDLGMKFQRLEIPEIAIKCNEEEELIIQTIKKMIKKKEINAEYFSKNKMIFFT